MQCGSKRIDLESSDTVESFRAKFKELAGGMPAGATAVQLWLRAAGGRPHAGRLRCPALLDATVPPTMGGGPYGPT